MLVMVVVAFIGCVIVVVLGWFNTPIFMVNMCDAVMLWIRGMCRISLCETRFESLIYTYLYIRIKMSVGSVFTEEHISFL